MKARILILVLLAVVFVGPKRTKAQSDAPDRKVTIEVQSTENGETTTTVRELDGTDPDAIEEALRELGIWEGLDIQSDGDNVSIDIRRWQEGHEGEALERAFRMMPGSGAAAWSGGAYLGVVSAPLDDDVRTRTKVPAESGAVVLETITGSAAEAAGLLVDDVITKIDDRHIGNPQELVEAIRAHKAGDTVEVTWYRGKKTHKATVALQERKAGAYAYRYMDKAGEEFGRSYFEGMAEKRAFLGVNPGEITSDKGAMIGKVELGSAAEDMDLRSGDVVTVINGVAVADFTALRNSIRGMKPGDTVSLTVLRDGATIELSGTLGETQGHVFMKHMDVDAPELKYNYSWEGSNPVDQEEFRREMEVLREEMEHLGKELGTKIRREMRVTIENRKLSEEEKALLRNKGVKGIDNELALEDLRTFPNPGTDFVRVSFTAPARGDLRVVLHDATGERVYEEQISAFSGRYDRTLDISDKAAGAYFLVVTQQGRAATAKLVKQ